MGATGFIATSTAYPHGDSPRYAKWISIGAVFAIRHLQYYEALLCAQDIRNGTNFHVKNQILQRWAS
jgi:hypothetical protein